MNAIPSLALLLTSAALMARGAGVETQVRFSTDRAEVAGVLRTPGHAGKVPCIVLLGGTLSQTRDGAMANPAQPPRDAMRRLAEALSNGGYASLRFDRVGFGESRGRKGWTGTYREESQVAAAAIQYARQQPRLGRVLAAGESAGAYLACLAAQDGTQADGYIFLGGLCSPAIEMYDYNFGRLARYADQSPENLQWTMQHARRDLALGRRFAAMFDATRAGLPNFEVVDGDYRFTLPLERRREELRFPPDEMFRHIRTPVLALAGAKDSNVPPDHAARIVQIIRAAGNTNGQSVLIPNADHSFQRVPEDADVAWRQRYTFESFKQPYAGEVYERILSWLGQVAPSPASPARKTPSQRRGE